MEWKAIPGFETLYEANRAGQIRYIKTGEIKTTRIDHNGYEGIRLTKGKKKIRIFVHRLIALSFIPNPLNKRFVNHINGNKQDNRAENLEWCTASENHYHAKKNGLWNNYGSNAKKAKLIESQVLSLISQRKQGIPVKELAKEYSIHEQTVYAILQGRNWSHLS